MAYHVIVVLALDGDVARIYDRTLQTVPAERLAAARARIRKDRNRLLADRAAPSPTSSTPCAPASSAARAARSTRRRRACRWRASPAGPTPGPSPSPRGAHRDGALRDMTAAIRRSGGGLLRNLQAQGLREAAAVLSLPDLLGVAELTASLAREWEALAADHDDLATRVRALYARETAAYETLQALLL